MSMPFYKLLLPCMALAFCAALSSPPPRAENSANLLLAENGQPRAAVLHAGLGRDGQLQSLARMLAGHLRQMAGVEFPVADLKEDMGKWIVEGGRFAPGKGKLSAQITSFIIIGESKASQMLGVTTEGLGPGGIRIRTAGNAIILLGVPDGSDSPGGVTYAAYQFLEALGCRWLWPGESGKVIPKQTTLAVPLLDVRFTPEIGWRHIRQLKNNTDNRMDAGLQKLGIPQAEFDKLKAQAMATEVPGRWLDWHCLGGDLGLSAGHDGAGMGRDAWEKYGKTHPEWFALQANGKRDQTGTEDRWRECVTAPGLIDFVANKIIADQKRIPRKSVSLSPNDNGKAGHCLCEACQALDPPEAPQVKFRVTNKPGQSAGKYIMRPALSDRFVWYWSQVAERVTKVYPDLLFVIDAYSGYKTPPVRQRLHLNLVLRYISSDINGWNGWFAMGAKRIYWRPNNLYDNDFGTLEHFIAPRTALQMNELIDKGMLGTDMDCILDNWAAMGLTYYVAAKTNWNPRLKYEAILDDYCTHGFGPAAGKIREYYQKLDTLSTGTLERYTPEAIASLRGLLGDAERAAAGDPAVMKRLDLLRAGLDFTDATAACDRLRQAARAGQKVDPAAVQKAMDSRWILMRRLTLQIPLAVNSPFIAGNEDYAWRELNWPGPSAETKAAAMSAQP